MQKIDWIIHMCRNGVQCECCGKKENGYILYMCNAHTHGMERYKHPDFQMVLNLPDEEIGRILNTFGLMVQCGRRFHNGEYVLGIYEDCSVRLMEFTECDRKVLRVVIPDTVQYIFVKPECGDDSETHTVREWFGEFEIPMEDEFFVSWQRTLNAVSTAIRRLESKLDPELMKSVWSAVFGTIYLNYDPEQDFFDQFSINSKRIVKYIRSEVTGLINKNTQFPHSFTFPIVKKWRGTSPP